MSNKNTAEKRAENEKGGRPARTRSLSVFPTDIALLDKAELAQLAFKPDGMAAEVLMRAVGY